MAVDGSVEGPGVTPLQVSNIASPPFPSQAPELITEHFSIHHSSLLSSLPCTHTEGVHVLLH